ncbi:uncharacterized protein LOC125234504 [Leguminivora glycinivorella]|uniref:uncharacterized protein LOC125234504 n=1 Tax=Leguminivora glycinivorella TaxID=1035111 RepID=UPI00200CF36A|nr:uncharacterized protein LOC125234504 [Leguminivora glycinivorella]
MIERLRPSLLLTCILLTIRELPCTVLEVASTSNPASDTIFLQSHKFGISITNSTNKLDTIMQNTKSGTSVLLSNTESTIKNMQAFQYVNNSKSRRNDNTTEHMDVTQSGKPKLFYKTKSPGKRIRYRRARDKEPPSQSELQPEGYVYDLNRCQYVDDRVLCGYDKNPDEPRKKEVIDLDDLCRSHGDRIECGYVTGPYPDPYNPDPEKDKIAKIVLSNYFSNIARSGGNLDLNDTNDYSEALRMGSGPNSLQNEIVKLRVEISKLVAALPGNTGIPSVSNRVLNTTPYTIPMSTNTDASTKETTKLLPEQYLDLSKILNLRSGTTSKLTLSHLMFGTEVTTPKYVKKESETKCVEKGGRIFCPTGDTIPKPFEKKGEKKCVEKNGKIYCRTILI